MLINCPECNVTVDAQEQGQITSYIDKTPEYKTILLECPLCGTAIVAGQELILLNFNTMEWGRGIRLWPSQETYISSNLPSIVSISLDEADKCYRGQAYLACAVMCGRVIEAICKDNGTRNKNIAGGLKELLERQVIDRRIYEWGEALRVHRNIGAHASDEVIIKEDARDLLDFSIAICEYVYILTQKFQNFMNRKRLTEEDSKDGIHRSSINSKIF